MLCFVVVMQSFIMNSHEVFIHIHQGCFAGTGAIVRLPQCQWSKPGGYGKISQCITTTKHSKATTVCIFIGIYCTQQNVGWNYLSIPKLKGSHHWSFAVDNNFIPHFVMDVVVHYVLSNNPYPPTAAFLSILFNFNPIMDKQSHAQ